MFGIRIKDTTVHCSQSMGGVYISGIRIKVINYVLLYNFTKSVYRDVITRFLLLLYYLTATSRAISIILGLSFSRNFSLKGNYHCTIFFYIVLI